MSGARSARMLIGDRWLSGKTPRKIVNPATEETLAEASDASVAEVDAAVRSAREAFPAWASKTPGERSTVLMKWAQLLEDNLQSLASLESSNTGKPLKLARDGDVPFAVDNLRFFAAAARLPEAQASGEYCQGYTSILRREPLGVCGLIAPWNYPLMMALWKLGPVLAAGNTAVIKPSELTPLTTLEAARLALESGLPEGVLNVVTGAEESGRFLSSHPEVRLVSFTGDTETGRKIMSQAAPTVKRIVMELGGKAPFVVFQDADIAAAVQGAVVGGFVNAGQDCTAAARIYVERPLYKEFLEQFIAQARTLRVGDPAADSTDMGPLISERQRLRVEGFLKRAAGARIALGGSRPQALKKGFYFEPTVVADAAQSSEIVQREVFGPLVCVLAFDGEAEAVALANDVSYGLAGSVWTKDVHKAIRVSKALRFGTVWVNDHLPLASEMPHGGLRESGFGKDMSKYALEECGVLKHVMIEIEGRTRKPWHYTVFGTAS